MHKNAIKVPSNRNFGLVFTIVFAAIAIWPMIQGGELNIWAGSISTVFALVTLFRPVWLQPLNCFWTHLGLFLHRIVNPIVLGIIFLFSILPIGLTMRFLGKDSLRLKRSPDLATYWIRRQGHSASEVDFRRQF
jgi:hypothetical protein